MTAKDGHLKIRSRKAISGAACLMTLLSDFAHSATIKAFDTHSHFKLEVDPSVTYHIQKIEQKGSLLGIRVFVESFKESNEIKNILENFKDDRTEKVLVQVDPNGLKSTFDILFKTSAVQKGIEYYDYRSKDNSEVIIDYWFKKGQAQQKALSEVSPIEEKPAQKIKKSIFNLNNLKLKFQKSASCNIPLNYELDGEFVYNIYHTSFNYKKYFKMKRPDDNYEYPNQKGEIEKNEEHDQIVHYRLAFKLSNEGKFALALRTIDLFQRKYRTSKLIPELGFLKISLFVELAKQLKTDFYKKEAIDLLSKVYLEAPESAKGKLAQMFLIQDTIEQNQEKAPYAVLQSALQAAENGGLTENVFLKQLFKMAAAESLQMLGESDRAESNYQQIIEMNGELSPEAAVRIGEVYLAKKLPSQAIFKFEEAIKKYPEKAKTFSPLWFNMAEAYHRLGNYKDSSKVYEKFLNLFPNDKNAWAAHFRLAEHRHLAMGSTNQDAIIENYDAVVNKAPYTIGATLAHLRNSDCLPQLTEKADKKIKLRQDFYQGFYKELTAKSFADPLLNSAEVEMISDYMEAKFNNKTGQYEEAFKKSMAYSPGKISKMKLSSSFSKLYDKNAYDLIVQLISEKKYAKALEQYKKFGAYLSEKSKNFNFKLSLAEANFGLKEYSEAKSIINEIQNNVLNENQDLKDKYRYLSARVFYNGDQNISKAISQLLLMSDLPELYLEKYDFLSRLNFESENFQATSQYCDKILSFLKGNRTKLFEISLLKLESMMRFESPEKVASFANEVFMKYGTLTDLKEKQLRLAEIRAQSLYDAGNYKDSLGALNFVIENNSDHPRLKEFEFMKAKSLAFVGLEKEAKEGFRKLAGSTGNDLWKKSAQAELDQLDWESNIKNQINENKDRRSLK